jgi:hypothetical protein
VRDGHGRHDKDRPAATDPAEVVGVVPFVLSGHGVFSPVTV